MDGESLSTFYRDMLLARRFEERAAQAYKDGRIGGFLHLYPGEEAVAVGVIRATDPGDYIVSTYREHVHALVRGISPGRLMAELFGKREGVCRGLGGSMHLFDRERRFYGGWAVVGETFPLALGVAYAAAMKKQPDVCVCFFGDGAVNQGTFHESMNMAGLWRLPILFICENNRYQIGTEIRRHSAVTDLSLRASVYNVATWKVDGMDVLAVHDTARTAIGKIRRGEGPQFIECETYRFRGHSMADPGTYRSPAETSAYLARDPLKDPRFSGEPPKDCIESFWAHCRERAGLSDDTLERIQSEVDKIVEESVLFAEKGHEPDLSDLDAIFPGVSKTSGPQP